MSLIKTLAPAVDTSAIASAADAAATTSAPYEARKRLMKSRVSFSSSTIRIRIPFRASDA